MYFILKHITITPPPTSPPPKNPDLPYKPHVSLKNSSICGFTFSDYSNVYTLYSFFCRARTNISKLNLTNACCQFSDIWLYLRTQNKVAIKSTDSGVSTSGISTPAITLSSCITLSMLFKLSMPQFLHLEK